MAAQERAKMASGKELGKKLGGITGTAAKAGIGAVAYGAYAMMASAIPQAKPKENETPQETYKRMRDYSWMISAPAVVLIAGSYWLGKKQAAAGASLAGAGGYALAETLTLGHSIRGANPEPKKAETGAMVSFPRMLGTVPETGAMLTASSIGDVGAVVDAALDEALEM